MTGGCLETLPDVQGSFQMSGSCREDSWMSGSDREALPDVREILQDVSKVLPDVQEVLPEVWEWLGVPPGCPGVVGRPSRMSGSGWASLLDCRVWSGNSPG